MSQADLEKISIKLPDEEFMMLDFTQDEQPGIAHINKSIKTFVESDGKKAFIWHLSLIMLYQDHIEEKMPSKAEHETLATFQQQIDQQLKAKNNALFVASITHNGYRELIWRIHDPYSANDVVHDIIESGQHPHPFDFTLVEDKLWQSAQWHIDALDTQEAQKPIPGKYWE